MTEVESCSNDPVIEKAPGDAGVLQQEFNGNELKLRTFVNAVCKGTKISGSYRLEGQALHLTYSEKITGDVTKCRCPRIFEHVIKLKKEPLEIKVDTD